MTGQWNYGHYEEFAARAISDLGLTFVDGFAGTEAAWGLRHLSRSDWKKLEERAKTDRDLGQRWLSRLQVGYDREKSRMAMEIEEIFADIPSTSDVSRDGREDAA